MSRGAKPHDLPDVSSLTAPMLALCQALAEGRTREDAARAAGVSTPTCYRWLRLPAVKQYLASLVDVQVDLAVRRLRAESDRAARTLVEVALGNRQVTSLQLQALLAVLDRALGKAAGAVHVEAVQSTQGQAIRIVVGHAPKSAE